MKDMIILAKKNRNNEGPLAIKNIDKIAMAEVAKMLSAIDFDHKYSWAISNGNIIATKNLRLTGIKKYWG